MKPISIQDACNLLYDIGENENINVEKYIEDINRCDCVPVNVLIFINKYRPVDQLATYNHIYNTRRKNPLYRNLVNESLPIEEKAIALSSYVTQMLIKSKELKRDGREEDSKDYLKISNIDIVTNALNEYANNDNEELLVRVFMMIRDVFKNIFFD